MLPIFSFSIIYCFFSILSVIALFHNILYLFSFSCFIFIDFIPLLICKIAFNQQLFLWLYSASFFKHLHIFIIGEYGSRHFFISSTFIYFYFLSIKKYIFSWIFKWKKFPFHYFRIVWLEVFFLVNYIIQKLKWFLFFKLEIQKLKEKNYRMSNLKINFSRKNIFLWSRNHFNFLHCAFDKDKSEKFFFFIWVKE